MSYLALVQGLNVLMQAIPWIVDVGYTVMCVALMLAVMGHVLFGDFEVTMTTLPDSISGEHIQPPNPLTPAGKILCKRPVTALLWMQVGACLLLKQHNCQATQAGFAHVCWSAWLFWQHNS